MCEHIEKSTAYNEFRRHKTILEYSGLTTVFQDRLQQTLHFHNDILKNLYNEKQPFAIFIDLSEAFDISDHEILMDKLHNHGIIYTSKNAT